MTPAPSQGDLQRLQARVAGLQSNEELYRQVAQLCPVPCWISVGDRLVFLNQAALSLVGGTDPDSWLGRTPAELNCGSTLTSYQFAYQDSIAELTFASGPVQILASIVDSSADAIIGKNLDGTIITWNQAAQRIFGYSPDEMIGKPITLLAAPGRENELPTLLARLQRGDRITHHETVQQRKDGQLIHIWLTVSPILDANGKTVGASTIARDITEAKRAERDLLENAGAVQRQFLELERLYSTAPVGLAFVDREHRFVRVNTRMAEINGRPASEHIGCHIRELMPELADPVEPILEKAITSGEALVRLDLPVTDQKGITKHFLLNFFPFKDAEQQVLGVSAVLEDITTIKAVETELRYAKLSLETVLASIQDPFLMLDDDWRLTYANNPAAELFKHSRAELDNKLLWDVLPFANTAFEESLRKAKDGAGPLRFQTLDRPGGAWTESLVYISSDGMSLLLRDITALKTAEEQRRQSDSIYRAIGESIDYGVWVCDAQGQNLYTSESFLKLTGLTAEECYGFEWLKALRPDVAITVKNEIDDCLKTGRMWDQEYWVHGADGEWHPILWRGVPVRNEAGQIVRWAGINLDIRAFKLAQQALEDSNQALSRTNEELEQFAYTASHDLQEPLRVMRLMGSLLSRRYAKLLDEDAGTYLATIEESADRMSNLVRDLLSYSRELHASWIPNTMADLNAAITIALQDCAALIEESGAILHCEHLPHVLAEPEQIARVFQNLICNAVKYRLAETPEISITADRRGAEWRFCVADNGEGISADQHENIFLPFTRLHGHEMPGSGIGLAVCKKIVERHGGRIWVESHPGEGAKFYFTLPIE